MAAPRVLALVLGAALGLPVEVSAVEVYTEAELTVTKGTEAKLPCTFTSTEVISSAASVTWSFQAEGAPYAVSFFYYSNGKPYPGKDVPFKDRITWAGDLNKKDASITIANMQFQDNGTYVCDVRNPPDILVTPGEISLRVVEKIPDYSTPDSADHDYPTRKVICLVVAIVVLLLLVFIVVKDHLFWKKQRCKTQKPLENMGNEERFPTDGSRTTQLLYQNVRL